MGGKKEKKSSNNKKDISHKNNKRDLFNKYPIIGITLLVVVGGIIIGYSYFGPTNSNLVSSLDRSNLLGDWQIFMALVCLILGLMNIQISSYQ